MLLAIDVGNTNVTLGVFEGLTLRHSWRMATLREKTSDEVGLFLVHLFHHSGIDVERLDGIVIASVVPPLTGTMVSAAEVYCGTKSPRHREHDRLGMKVLYDNPAEVGADRIVNAVAAYEAYGRADAHPLIVVDFGTATTFDAVSGAGEYLGGIICPGDSDLRRRAVPEGRQASARRRPQAAVAHRPHDRGVDAVGTLLRLRGDGRGHRPPDAVELEPSRPAGRLHRDRWDGPCLPRRSTPSRQPTRT